MFLQNFWRALLLLENIGMKFKQIRVMSEWVRFFI